nr:patatin-like protein 2 [Tanacetum cinerariifolium]
MNLCRRNIQVPDLSCPVCKNVDEEVSHLLFSCPLSGDVHRLVCRWWNLAWSPLSSYEEWLSWFKDIRFGSILKSHPFRKDTIFDDIVTRSYLWCHARFLNASPLTNIFTQANGDLVDYRINNIFHILRCPDNFLRIQDDTLTGDLPSTDIATDENLEALNQVGIKLLEKPVCRADFRTGEFKPVEGGGTNREALQKFVLKPIVVD